MRRLLGPLWFGLGLGLGALVGGGLVAASVRPDTHWSKERRVLWSMVEVQGDVIARCDQILVRLGLEP